MPISCCYKLLYTCTFCSLNIVCSAKLHFVLLSSKSGLESVQLSLRQLNLVSEKNNAAKVY